MPGWKIRPRYLARVTLALLLALTVTTAASGAPAAGWTMVPPQRLAALLKEGSGMWLVDVRGGAAFENRHIEGAMNIPPTLMPTKKFPRHKTIVLVDDSLGQKSSREAAEILSGKGVEHLLLLDGGLYGWQAEGLPVATRGAQGRMPQVTPEELDWAQKNGVGLAIYDLRDPDDRRLHEVKNALAPDGESLAERLTRLKELLAVKGRQTLAGKLAKPAPAVLVLPMAADLKQQVESALAGIPGDLRYLDGGYAAWMAQPERKPLKDPTGPYCSEKKVLGGIK